MKTLLLTLTTLLLVVPSTAFAGGGMNCGFGSWTADDEILRLYPTYAVQSADGKTLTLPIHVRVFEREDDRMRRYAIDGFAKTLDIEDDTKERKIFDSRMRDFLVDNESGEEVHLRVQGEGVEQKTHLLGETNDDGHLQKVLTIRVEEGKKIDSFFVVGRIADQPSGTGVKQVEVPVIPAKGLTVISDIDDTTKLTNVLDKKEMLANTFTREFRPAPGMAERFAKWEKAGAAFHYLSASPWNLERDLREFADAHGFPSGVYHLRILKLTDLGSISDFLSSSKPHKLSSIRTLLKRFPEREFILVGDTGEADPEIYGEVARQNPEQIRAIYLRDVRQDPDSAALKKAMKGVPANKWTLIEP